MGNITDFFFPMMFVQKLRFSQLPPTPDQVGHGFMYLVFDPEANLSQDVE